MTDNPMKHIAEGYGFDYGFTLADMHYFAAEAWGPLGTATVNKWAEFNRRYFDGRLRPVPLVITHTQPYGRRLAFCSYSPDNEGRTITLNVPQIYKCLLADNDSLLHEMVHQGLFECGEDAAHASAGWRREIMRLHELVTGCPLWAGRSKVKRIDGKVVRINEAAADGTLSLTQGEIARWPRSVGIDLGQLGAT
jgi:hypothetical protein